MPIGHCRRAGSFNDRTFTLKSHNRLKVWIKWKEHLFETLPEQSEHPVPLIPRCLLKSVRSLYLDGQRSIWVDMSHTVWVIRFDMAIKMVEFWRLLKVHPDLVQKQQNKQGKTNGSVRLTHAFVVFTYTFPFVRYWVIRIMTHQLFWPMRAPIGSASPQLVLHHITSLLPVLRKTTFIFYHCK